MMLGRFLQICNLSTSRCVPTALIAEKQHFSSVCETIPSIIFRTHRAHSSYSSTHHETATRALELESSHEHASSECGAYRS